MARNRGKARGFTLLEILVVLAIAGLLAGVVLPQLQKMAASVETSNQRADIRAAIEGLGYRAYVSGKAIQLASVESSGGDGSNDSKMAIRVPAGWRVHALQPVDYAENGVCSGGRIVITNPARVREAFALKPPRCRLEPIEIAE